ncbi:hypothetical protein ACN38_g2482 [Penicillium nordicum]|uniref:Uncharacterized protein n=1 Tax=Penicillium nordicum TaxID=229535 RepID=A0A0M9WIW7_9EURO|nr:hypothetical protein ACN38_g2482 [Penicillium nordicum]
MVQHATNPLVVHMGASAERTAKALREIFLAVCTTNNAPSGFYLEIGGHFLPKSEVILNFKDVLSPFVAYGQMKIYRED